MSKGVADSRNMIIDVISEETVGEDVMATEIKHAYHPHNLILTFKGEMKDDKICDGCMGPISIPFYECQQCRFFLHKSCAELPREKGHAIHKHLLKLKSSDENFSCDACFRYHSGFSYICDREECFGYKIDVQCSLQPDTLMHPSHEHSLFLAHNYYGPCSGCNYRIGHRAYRCMKRCEYALGFCCLKLPQKVGFKYDKHPLTLTYYDNSDPTQLYCDLCEKKRDSKEWFYYCACCDNSVHEECALGQFPFIKIGSTDTDDDVHPHSLTLVDNIWDCPPCHACGRLCYRQALECKESGCDCIVHLRCRYR